MLLQDIWDFIQEWVFTADDCCEKPLFNFYHRCDLEVDLPGADLIRRENLRLYLQNFSEQPSVLVVGEAPGWRGCRFSGVPFTSQAQLLSGELPFAGRLSGCASSPRYESTATVFWQAMRPYHPMFLVWNCVPLHPYRPGNLLSNRPLDRQEITCYLPLLREMIALLAPRWVLAVGRVAKSALDAIDTSAIHVRHPSHGGAKAFKDGVESVLTESLCRPF
jgi:uracil-DNA glycosylase